MKIKVITLLFALAVATAAAVYVRNGHCFRCEEESSPTECGKHIGPCSNEASRIDFDDCRTPTLRDMQLLHAARTVHLLLLHREDMHRRCALRAEYV